MGEILRTRKILLLLVSVIFWLSGLYYLRHERNILEELYLQHQTSSLHMAWRTVVKSYHSAMQTYLESYILQPQVLSILREAQHESEQDQAVSRAKLYRLLAPVYEKMQRRDVRQLHFHTPDSYSFLRFHAPHWSGDSLAQSRPSVVIANRSHVTVQGFETGRVVAGFRNVFPLTDQGVDLGSVEISQPFESLRKEMWRLDRSNEFMLVYPAASLLPKLFEEQKKMYAPAPFGEEWMVEDEKQKLPDSPAPMAPAVTQLFADLRNIPGFAARMQSAQPGSIAFSVNSRFYKLTMLPLIDVSDELAAVLMALSPAPELEQVKHNFWQHLLIFSLMCLFGGGAAAMYLQSREIMEKNRQQYQKIANTISDGLFVVNGKDEIIFVNDGAAKILGYTAEEMTGKSPHTLFHTDLADGECQVSNVFVTGTGFKGEILFKHKDGSSFVSEVASEPMKHGENVVSVVTIFRDVTERRQMQERLLQMCNSDPLTKIYNRRYFLQVLETELQRSCRYGTPFSLVMCDIDHFKRINDTLGHAMGDKALNEIVAAIQNRIRAVDTFARWGGEEFVLLLANTGLADAVPLIEDIRETIAALNISGIGHLTVSFGVTSYREEDTTDTLIIRADMLLYTAKGSGRNCVRSA